jgi:hypothetical protein
MENYIFLKYICESFLPLKGLLHHSDIIWSQLKIREIKKKKNQCDLVETGAIFLFGPEWLKNVIIYPW